MFCKSFAHKENLGLSYRDSRSWNSVKIAPLGLLLRRTRGQIVFLFCALAVCEALAAGKPTLADAEGFMTNAEALLNDVTVKASRAQWVQATYITDDTETIAAEANERVIDRKSTR